MIAGRLDQNTTGLLLFTNDGMLNRMLCLATNVEKTYIATTCRPVTTPPTNAQLASLLDGVELKDGPARALKAELLPDHTLIALRQDMVGKVQPKALFSIRVVVSIGRNHIVKRLLHAVGLQVVQLHRESYGPVLLRLAADKNASSGSPDAPAVRSNNATEGRESCVSIQQPGESVKLNPHQVQQLWDAGGGSNAVARLQACQLLCKYRASLDVIRTSEEGAGNMMQKRTSLLGKWLERHWTLKGPCFAGFSSCACMYHHSIQSNPI